jgi:hypothetical protein
LTYLPSPFPLARRGPLLVCNILSVSGAGDSPMQQDAPKCQLLGIEPVPSHANSLAEDSWNFLHIEIIFFSLCYFSKLPSQKLNMWLIWLHCRLVKDLLDRSQLNRSQLQLYFLLAYNSILWFTLSAEDS